MVMPVVHVGRDTIFFAERQRGASRHLLLVHGAGDDHTVWGHQLAHVRHANTYALDLPGHGRSTGTGRMTIADYAADVYAFLDALDLDQVVIAGHSMGGAIAQTLTLSSPDCVAGLVLAGTGARLRGLPTLLDELRTDFPTGVRTLVGLAYHPDTPADMVDRGLNQWLKSRPGVLHADFLACDQFDVMGRLGEITCPTLVICGTQDRLTPVKYATYLRDHIPDADLVLIEDAGHMVMVEQAEPVSRAIDAFLARLANML
jgi:pimeloyl-ACP methyl ester carboxylesterase